MTNHADVIVVGAGIAGASAAWFLSAGARVAILEAEDHPGYHSTGRSAAFYAETYGGRRVQPLTTASKAFLFDPPEDFSDGPFIGPRGALHVAGPDEQQALDRLAAEFADSGVAVEWLGPQAAAEMAPLLANDWRQRTLYEVGCRDIDVARLHQAFLAGSRRRGAALHCGARAARIKRDGGVWRVSTTTGNHTAPVLVNASGAWADAIAGLAGLRPIGIEPRRRTVVVAALDAPPSPRLPLVIDASGALYFKPDAGQMWISPHDETVCAAGDVQPEEIDVATAVDRFEAATTSSVRRVVRSWAGLRSFAPDRLPVYGFAPEADGFFWCAGQGGFGIQTSPAAGALTAALILGTPAPGGIDHATYSPDRFG